MNRTFIVALLALSTAAKAALFETHSADLAEEAVLASRDAKLLAVLFERDGCSACRKLRTDVFSDPSTERRFGKTFRTVSVNLSNTRVVTTPAGRKEQVIAWTQHLRVFGTPALVFFDRNGQLLYRHVGPVSDQPELIALGTYVVCREMEHRPFRLFTQSRKRIGRTAAVKTMESCHASN